MSELSQFLEEGPARQFMDELAFFCKRSKLTWAGLARHVALGRATLYRWKSGGRISVERAAQVSRKLSSKELERYTRPRSQLSGPGQFLEYFECWSNMPEAQRNSECRKVVGYCCVWLTSQLEGLGITASYSEVNAHPPYVGQVLVKMASGNPRVHVQFLSKEGQLLYQGFTHHPGGVTLEFEGVADPYAFQNCVEFMAWAAREPTKREVSIAAKMNKEIKKYYDRTL